MNELDITWGRVAKIWWSLAWRGLLFGTLAGAGVGFAIGFLGGLLGQDVDSLRLYSGFGGLAVGVFIGLWVVRTVLRRRFRDFRLALVSHP